MSKLSTFWTGVKPLLAIFCLVVPSAAIANAGLEELLSRSELEDQTYGTGRFQHQSMENEGHRSLVLLTREEKIAFGLDPRQIAFSNFRHGGEFYVATVDGLSTEEVPPASTAEPLLKNVSLIRVHWAIDSRLAARELEVHS